MRVLFKEKKKDKVYIYSVEAFMNTLKKYLQKY